MNAALVLAVSSLVFSVMALFAKEAAVRLPGPQVAFMRFAFGLLACAAVPLFRPLRARNKLGLLLRGALGGGAVLCYFLAIQHLPVGLATLLNFTAPVFTAIWAALFLGERLDARAVAALGVTTLGVTLVSWGGIGARASAWVLVGCASAVISGAAIATIREVRKTDGSWEIFAAMCVGGLVVTGIPAAHLWVAPSAREWGLLAAVGLTSIIGQMGLTWSLRELRAVSAGLLMQLTPIGALALGWLVYGDVIAPLAGLGALVTVAGVTWGAARNPGL